MKALLLLGVLLLAQVVPVSAETKESAHQRYLFAISPYLERSARDEIFRGTVRFILESMPLDSSLVICDGYNLQSITEVKIPALAAFNSAKTRANQTREQVGRLRTFLAAQPALPEADGLGFTNAVRLPQLLEFVSEHFRPTNGTIRVLVYGSPLHLDSKETGFSMAQGFFPSDGHLKATREESIYGSRSKEAALKGIDLYFAHPGEPWVNELHREKITRFWSLFAKSQGSRLVTLGSDLASVFKALNDPAKTALSDQYPLEIASTKIEMLRLGRAVDSTDWISRDDIATARVRPSKTVGPMKIGIRWKGKIDLDLYASASESAETLYFEHTRTAEGYYYKDHRSSPDREYEFIEFETPVDVWKARARINYFEGRSDGGPEGEVRIEFDGKVYSAKFRLEADHGNEGREGNRQREFWTDLDIPAILKLRDPGSITAGR